MYIDTVDGTIEIVVVIFPAVLFVADGKELNPVSDVISEVVDDTDGGFDIAGPQAVPVIENIVRVMKPNKHGFFIFIVFKNTPFEIDSYNILTRNCNARIINS